MKRTIGIDLGTTNTVAAVESHVLQRSAGLEQSAILPSVVAFPPNGVALVGSTAKNRRAIDAKNTLYSTKRLMGQRWLSYSASHFRKHYPFELEETAEGACAFVTRAGTFTPTQVAAKIIDKVFAAQQALRSSAQAVITVPAAFAPEARTATVEAARMAGLDPVRIVDEPVATAAAYATLEGAARPRCAAVYDLGGGTFDLAIVDCQKEPASVICNTGDAYLGGDDIDIALAECVASEVLKRHNWDLRSNPEVFERLVVQCERAKIRLSLAESTQVQLSQVDPAAPGAADSVRLTRDTLIEVAQDHVNRSFLACDQVLRMAGLTVSDIDAVYLAGGATLLPVVRESVAHYFGSLPRCEFDPMEVVAIGASLLGE